MGGEREPKGGEGVRTVIHMIVHEWGGGGGKGGNVLESNDAQLKPNTKAKTIRKRQSLTQGGGQKRRGGQEV